jgi:hypothetical protein
MKKETHDEVLKNDPTSCGFILFKEVISEILMSLNSEMSNILSTG